MTSYPEEFRETLPDTLGKDRIHKDFVKEWGIYNSHGSWQEYQYCLVCHPVRP